MNKVKGLQHRIASLEQANTELNKRYEGVLQQLNTKQDTLHQLIDDISHDLRLPLSTMTTYLYLLKHSNDSENTPQYLEILGKQLVYLTDVINNLISMVRLDMNATDFDLRSSKANDILASIVETIHPVASKKNQTISTDFTAQLPAILIDRVKITRALMNVVQNAITYTPEYGEISIYSSHNSSEFILIEITDTGIGIDLEHTPYIFDRFYRVNKSHTEGGNSGLGLAITKQIIENHHGRIEVKSEINKGTSFYIYLPTLITLASSYQSSTHNQYR